MDIKEIQNKVRLFTDEKGLNIPLEVRMMDLVAEIGEMAKEILKQTNYGKKSFKGNEDWLGEMGDVFFSLICLANTTEIDLEEGINRVLDKYQKRFEDKGSIGSD